MFARTACCWVCVVVLAAVTDSYAQRPTTGRETALPKISKVFVNVTGERKYAERLWTFLGYEFEDIGVQLESTEKSADAVISVRVSEEIQQSSLYVGVAHTELEFKGRNDVQDWCESISTGADSDLFSSSGEQIVSHVKQKHPELKSLRVASTDVGLSGAFSASLISALRSAGVTQVEEGNADATLRLRLSRVEVPLTRRNIRYEAEILDRDGVRGTATGSVTLAAQVSGAFPKICPERFGDLDWVESDSLYDVAIRLVKTMRNLNLKPSKREHSVLFAP